MKPLEQYKTVLDSIHTTQQNNACLDALHHAEDATYDSSKNVIEVLDDYLPYNITDAIVDLAEEQGYHLRDGGDAGTFMKDLIEVLEALPIVDIKVAFHPTYDQIHRMTAWWRQEVDPYAILNINVEPQIIAGAVIGFKGKIHDYSLQKGLETFLKHT